MTDFSFRTLMKRLALGFAALSVPVAASGQSLLRYDEYSFFEEGLATQIGGATLRFNGLFDVATVVEPQDADPQTIGTLQFSAALETQLYNGWHAGLLYLGKLTRADNSRTDNRYAGFVDAPWGRLSFGDVTDQLVSAVSRSGGVGLARLGTPRGFVGLHSAGLHYRQTINAFQTHLAVDREGNAQLGLVFEAPIAKGSQSYGLRLGRGRLEHSSGNAGRGDVTGAALFAGYGRGALHLGAELGIDDVDLAFNAGSDRHLYWSLGARFKKARLSLSAEIGRSRFMSVTRDCAALGLRYDLVRGLSVNAGVNYLDDGSTDTWTVPLSLRYEF